MKKNGFIATSILYTFFLVFLTLFVALIANYLHNRVLLAKIDETSREILAGINNTRLIDLEVGEHIKFKSDDNLLNSEATWTVALIETNGLEKKYYFISDLNAVNNQILYQRRPFEKVDKIHTLTVDLYENIITNKNNLINGNYPTSYDRAIKYSGFTVYMVNSSFLTRIRNEINDPLIIDELLNPGGNYLVYIDSTISGRGPNGVTSRYHSGDYYEIKRYNFTSSEQNSLIPKYCGGEFKNLKATYVENNKFGFIHIGNEPINKDVKYVDYCYYASPVPYNHPNTELVVQFSEDKPNDIISSKQSNAYNFRMIAEITVSANQATPSYIAGGKGTVLDPYVFTDGRKQSWEKKVVLSLWKQLS